MRSCPLSPPLPLITAPLEPCPVQRSAAAFERPTTARDRACRGPSRRSSPRPRSWAGRGCAEDRETEGDREQKQRGIAERGHQAIRQCAWRHDDQVADQRRRPAGRGRERAAPGVENPAAHRQERMASRGHHHNTPFNVETSKVGYANREEPRGETADNEEGDGDQRQERIGVEPLKAGPDDKMTPRKPTRSPASGASRGLAQEERRARVTPSGTLAGWPWHWRSADGRARSGRRPWRRFRLMRKSTAAAEGAQI